MILDRNREALIHGNIVVDLSHTAFKIIRRLEIAKGRVVPWDSLIASVWDNPDREPEDARKSVQVIMCRVKRNAEKQGIPLPAISRKGIGWMLNIAAFRDEAHWVREAAE